MPALPVTLDSSRKSNRRRGKRRAQLLEYATIGWAATEFVGGVVLGVHAINISLLSFGTQSLIEVALSSVMLWRLSQENRERRLEAEARALRFAGIALLAIAALTTLEAAISVMQRHRPWQTPMGMLLAIAALLVMPALALGKRAAAASLGSRALQTDAIQNSFCAYQAGLVFIGLVLYRYFGWWWTDAVFALSLVPLMIRQGFGALRGELCSCAAHSHEHPLDGLAESLGTNEELSC
jgi:divalent metal cation (Fe/Co/Zn/Cd) transporter